MGAGRGKTRRVQASAVAPTHTVQSLEDSDMTLLRTAQNPVEENILRHAQALKVDILINPSINPWNAGASLARSSREKPYIQTAPLTSSLTELIALHELGHVACKHPHMREDEEEVLREHEAWEWA